MTLGRRSTQRRMTTLTTFRCSSADPGEWRRAGRGFPSLRAPPGQRSRPLRLCGQRRGWGLHRGRRRRAHPRTGPRRASATRRHRWPGSSASSPHRSRRGTRPGFASPRATHSVHHVRSWRLISPCAASAWPRCSIPATAAGVTRSSTAPTAGHVSPSRVRLPYDRPNTTMGALRCAMPVRSSTTIRRIGASTPSPWPLRCGPDLGSTVPSSSVAGTDTPLRQRRMIWLRAASSRSRGSAATTSRATPHRDADQRAPTCGRAGRRSPWR